MQGFVSKLRPAVGHDCVQSAKNPFVALASIRLMTVLLCHKRLVHLESIETLTSFVASRAAPPMHCTDGYAGEIFDHGDEVIDPCNVLKPANE